MGPFAPGCGDPAQRVRLGLALQARASEIAGTVEQRVAHATANTFRNCELATQTVGRWLAGGVAASARENEIIAANGRAAADRAISVTDMTKNYLVWRDTTKEALVEEARRLGVDDATLRFALQGVHRSCDSSLVRMAKQYDVARGEMEQELDAEREALNHQVRHDALTGLGNRVLLLDHLARTATSNRTGDVAVLFLDLDGFKAVNDGLGHDAGDALLVAVAARLAGLVRPGDIVARLGGDEFVILCDNLQGGQRVAEALAERVQRVLAEPFVVLGTLLMISASIGVALAPAGPDPEALLAQADSAMYAAKRRGRSRYEAHDGQAQQQAIRSALLRRSLPWALPRGELHLHYQPVTAVGSQQIVSLEALLRWTHPTLGVISPSEFICLAEESALICAIGVWVLAEACRQTAVWRDEHHWDIGIGVNLSARQLEDTDIVHVVRQVLHETGLPAHALTLEITESRLMCQPEQAITVLTALKQLGVRLAIDDFGTGYSSLAYLRRLPVDVLKVDRSFVTPLGTDEREQASTILGSIVRLAHDLGLSVIGEGVETQAELAELRRVGCDQIQGYLLGRPRPPQDVAVPLRAPAPRAWTERDVDGSTPAAVSVPT